MHEFHGESMEYGSVDRTVIDCRQNQLDQMADFSPLLTKSQTMRHTQMN